MENADIFFVEQVKKGEVEAYSELVLRYQKPIYNLMFRFCYCKEDATELTQDVFCNAFEKLPSYKVSKPFFPWLYTLAMNHGRDWARRKKHTNEGLHHYSQLFENGTSPSLIDNLVLKQEIDQMFLALSKLPYKKREMLLLKYKKGFSTRDLGEIFGLSDSGVKMRINRALKDLQEMIRSKRDYHENR